MIIVFVGFRSVFAFFGAFFADFITPRRQLAPCCAAYLDHLFGVTIVVTRLPKYKISYFCLFVSNKITIFVAQNCYKYGTG